jgi:hypothetical protein
LGPVTVVSGAYKGWEQINQAVFIPSGGYFTVTGISGNNLVLANLASNLPSGVTVNAANISPAGIPGATGPIGPGAGAVLSWGTDTINTTTTTRFLAPGYIAAAGTTDVYRIRAPRAGTLRNLHIMQNTVSSSTTNITYTVLVNGVSSALTITMAANVTTAADTADTVVIAKGDQITLQVTKAGTLASAVQQVVVSVEFV